MKLSRIAAAGAGLALVGASVLAGAGAAQADDFYLTTADLTATETSPYSPGWFRGNVSGLPGTATSTLSGLQIVGGNYQLLNGTPGATDLTDAAQFAHISVASGAASLQIPVFTGPAGTNYTTLYADNAGLQGNVWYTSTAFGPYAAGATDTLANFEAAMAADYQILAFGFNTVGPAVNTVTSLGWNGDIYYFTPVPVASLTPNTVTTGASDTTSFTFTSTGFVPGDEVELYMSSGNSGGLVGTPNVFADATGTATFTWTFGTEYSAGAYIIGAFAGDSRVNVNVPLTITANAVAAAALPNTGADATSALIGAGSLLVAGLGFAVVAMRRRAAANN